jgi:membrane protease YdiL (CAAX protease family)
MGAFRLSPWLAAFIGLFVVSEGVRLSRGGGTESVFVVVALAVFCLLTWWFTRKGEEPLRSPKGRLIVVQLIFCAFIVLLTGLDGTVFNRVAPAWLLLPGWHDLRDAIVGKAGHYLPFDLANGVANTILYCVPVAVVLLALGVPLRALGLGRFRAGSLASGLTWLVPPLSFFAWFVLTGRVPVAGVLRIWVSNLLQNGFGEEFLFRGAIMGRLSAVMGDERALYLQALLFGLWHFGADFHAFKGDLLATFAEMIATQAAVGLAFGYVTQRTGNIAISSVFHLLLDSTSEIG